MIMRGYGLIHWIDLSKRSVRSEQVPDDLAWNFIGGKGLGAKILYDMTDEKTDPLGPENPLIFAIGPFTGTAVPYSGKGTFVFKSPQTGILGESVIGGTLGAATRWVGTTALVIMNRADRPTYLVLSENGVELRDASHLWGKDIYETEEELKKEHGRCSVASIGPAGENLVKFAAIGNEKWRQAGRTGGGAVMGSKKLKAIVVEYDKQEWDAHDPDGVRKYSAEEIVPRAKEELKSYFERGTPGTVELANLWGFFPSYYWSKGSVDGWENIAWDAIKREVFVHPRACFGCATPCGRYSRVREGKYAGSEVELEYETIFAIGGLNAITDIKAIVWLNDQADRLGMDTITLGNVFGFAIEAYKRGKLDPGFKLDYGDPESLHKLAEMIAKREGVGDILAEGVARASKALGLEEIAIHVKGLEPAGYDPRTLKSMILGYGVSPRGACHLRITGYYADIRGLGGDRKTIDMEKTKVLANLEELAAIGDSLVLCRFSTRTLIAWEQMAKYYSMITGRNATADDMIKAARRIINLTRMYNVRLGLRRKDDRLPRRLLKESFIHDGEERRITEEEQERFLDLYYELRGWDKEGVPKQETLRELNLI
jgi:aldehyde:ferredoxin oxidoreductase